MKNVIGKCEAILERWYTWIAPTVKKKFWMKMLSTVHIAPNRKIWQKNLIFRLQRGYYHNRCMCTNFHWHYWIWYFCSRLLFLCDDWQLSTLFVWNAVYWNIKYHLFQFRISSRDILNKKETLLLFNNWHQFTVVLDFGYVYAIMDGRICSCRDTYTDSVNFEYYICSNLETRIQVK